MTFEGLFTQVLNGLTIGAILMLIAMGLTLIFGLMGVVNFAHGALYMVGAYFGLEIVNLTGEFALAIVIAPLIVGAIGYLLERTIIRPLYGGDPLKQVLLTFGVAVVLSEVVQMVWGPKIQPLSPPEALSGSIAFLGIQYPVYRLAILLVAVIVAGLIWLVLRRTNIGLVVRSGTHDSKMVEALGVNIRVVFAGVFVTGTMLAALAGVLVAPLRNVQPQMGAEVIVFAFIAVIIGGLGSVGGAIAGALLVGVAEVLGALIIPGMAKAAIYVIVVIVLIVKPGGLFGGRTAGN